MKFSLIDQDLNKDSFNPLDLVNFNEIKLNNKEGYPAFIIRGPYIKTITKIPGVDFFNLSVNEQEEKVSYWGAFLASLKCSTQIMVHSVPIDTDKYLNEVSSLVSKSPYLKKEIKEKILNRATGLGATLNYIKRDGNTTPFKKEYYIITSSQINFNGENIHEIKNELDGDKYNLGGYRSFSDIQWRVYEENFNNYYSDILGLLASSFDERATIDPLSKEEEIIGLFAELNNGIKRESIPLIKNI